MKTRKTKKPTLLERCFHPDAGVRARAIEKVVKPHRDAFRREQITEEAFRSLVAHGTGRCVCISLTPKQRRHVIADIKKRLKPRSTYAWLKPGKRARLKGATVSFE